MLKFINSINKAILLLLIIFSCLSFANLSDFKLKGSFRFRYQIDIKDTTNNDSFRQRQHIQIKFGSHKKLGGHAKIGLELVSGSNDPISTNQTLSEGFSSKGINLDQAFIQYFFVPSFSLLLGKFKNPFRKQGSSFIYDSDLRPEGITAIFSHKFDKLSFYAQLGYYQLLEQRKQNLNTLVFQTGSNINNIFVFEATITTYRNLQGSSLFIENNSFGNSTTTNDHDTTYKTDFNIIDVYDLFV